jgi:hypothetical protein
VAAPKVAFRTAAAAALNVLWPLVYSGNGGVVSSGRQAGSAARFELPPPSTIAVIGRQKW